MELLQKLIKEVQSEGEVRETRSGTVKSVFDPRTRMKWDLREGFPVTSAKKLAWKSMVGELLWFLNGETTLAELKYRTNLDKDSKTIWTPDLTRWNSELGTPSNDDLGLIYGYQWRSYGFYEGVGESGLSKDYVDQIQNLVTSLKENPSSRYHMVMAWNPKDIHDGSLALPPCHYGFQCFVSTDGYLDLKWNQRSWDLFLGAPFNISSYALLLVILGKLTNLTPRYLSVNVGDAHIYLNQMKSVDEYLARRPKNPNFLFDMPEIETLKDLESLTAEDFPVAKYISQGTIKAPVSVG